MELKEQIANDINTHAIVLYMNERHKRDAHVRVFKYSGPGSETLWCDI